MSKRQRKPSQHQSRLIKAGRVMAFTSPIEAGQYMAKRIRDGANPGEIRIDIATPPASGYGIAKYGGVEVSWRTLRIDRAGDIMPANRGARSGRRDGDIPWNDAIITIVIEKDLFKTPTGLSHRVPKINIPPLDTIIALRSTGKRIKFTAGGGVEVAVDGKLNDSGRYAAGVAGPRLAMTDGKGISPLRRQESLNVVASREAMVYAVLDYNNSLGAPKTPLTRLYGLFPESPKESIRRTVQSWRKSRGIS